MLILEESSSMGTSDNAINTGLITSAFKMIFRDKHNIHWGMI